MIRFMLCGGGGQISCTMPVRGLGLIMGVVPVHFDEMRL